MIQQGQYVYYQQAWSNAIIKAQVIRLEGEDHSVAYLQDICYPAFDNKEKDEPAYGRTHLPLNRLYTSLEGLQSALAKKWEQDVQGYKDEITTKDDLVAFPLMHCFNGEEYTDKAAVRAYVERAIELGFQIARVALEYGCIKYDDLIDHEKEEVEYE